MEMVERVAGAIWLAEYDEELPPAGSVTHAMALQMASAALTAMREPTKEMLASVDGEDGDKYVSRGRAFSAWQAMIDAALLPTHGSGGK